MLAVNGAFRRNCNWWLYGVFVSVLLRPTPALSVAPKILKSPCNIFVRFMLCDLRSVCWKRKRVPSKSYRFWRISLSRFMRLNKFDILIFDPFPKVKSRFRFMLNRCLFSKFDSRPTPVVHGLV